MYDHPIMLSYPRSGRSFLVYCVMLCTKRVLDYQDHYDPDAILALTHMTEHIDQLRGISLILLLRNYKECILRHNAPMPDGQCSEGNYWNNVVYFHKYPFRKMVLYYEDIIKFPYPNLVNLMGFLGIDPSILNERVFKDFDKHFKDSIDAYHPGSQTEGDPEKLIFHSKNMSPNDAKNHDKALRDRDPHIYRLYLSRYATP